MKGAKKHQIAWSIAFILSVAGGLFVSLAIYASRMIWPDPAEVLAAYSDDALLPTPDEPSTLEPDALPFALVAIVDQPAVPELDAPSPVASALAPVPSWGQPGRMAAAFRGSPLQPGNDLTGVKATPLIDMPIVLAFSSDAFAVDTPTEAEDVFRLGIPTDMVSQAVHGAGNTDYELDMRIAALAEPVPSVPPNDVFVVAKSTPAPVADQVFTVGEPAHWPQLVDHQTVVAVSQSLAMGDGATGNAPTIKAANAAIPSRAALQRIAMPQVQLASVSSDLLSPPPLIIKPAKRPEDVEVGEFARTVANVLAATPIPTRTPQVATRPTTPTRPVRADLVPVSAPVAAPPKPVDGRPHLSVVGVFQTDGTPWALLELSDGRIIKATRGTQFDAIKISRIRGDKVWVRNGGSEKGLTTGQFMVLK
ncbi:hypothetical protein [uncultured Aliiroseovarius sp.]|uniref:hypothetical protein n=1 Tax=uncultured Aliiroseovarius sp. TaxID=1658783 RepID=UPI002593FD4E|nr:hypothetical protein [uncultured Aliiroseovarius sp.]